MPDLNNIQELINTVQQNQQDIAALKALVAKLQEMVVDPEKKAELNVDEDCEGFYTIDEIVMKYEKSVTTIGKWKKLVHLKPAGKKGKKTKYNKKKVETWYKKIELLKISNPELFEVKIKKAS